MGFCPSTTGRYHHQNEDPNTRFFSPTMSITMNRFLLGFLSGTLFFLLLSCNPASTETNSDETNNAESAEETETPNVNVDSIVNVIDDYRSAVESSVSEPVEVSTADLREKIKQKWEKIHFYTQDGQVVRVKTYPYADITNRTEEFYFRNGDLLLVVIEDDGTGDRGKAKDQLDKMYYYDQGEPMEEVNASGEGEYSIRKSDAEELMQEAREYLEIFKDRQ